MIRLAGALLVVGASATLGFFASAMYREQARQLEGFVILISHISAQIDGFLSPLSEIFASFKNKSLEKCGFLTALSEMGGAEALSFCRSRLYLSDEELGELERFFSGLGHHSPEEEMRHCAYYEKKMTAFSARAADRLSGKVKICKSFGLLIGVMLAVMLL